MKPGLPGGADDRACQKDSSLAARSVLIVCNDGDYFLRHRRAVADRLAREGVETHVVAGGTAIPLDRRAGWTYDFLPIERFAFHPLRDLALAVAVMRLIAARKPASVHLITLKPVVFGGIAALLTRLILGRPSRILLTIPGLGRLMSPGDEGMGVRGRTARFLVGRAMRLLSRSAAVRFTFETNEDRNVWLDRGLIDRESSLVIKGAGVDADVFFPPARPAPLPPEGPVTVLFASRLMRAKGLDVFIEVARHFAGRADLRFVVAGMIEPHDPNGYRPRDLQRERSIDFLGEVRDMAGLLRQVHLVCLPTRYGEGIPRILIEAAATGVACIASDIDGCREIVRDGVSGTLVAAAPPRTMAQAMIDAIEAYAAAPHLLAQHGEAGLRIFREGSFEEDAVVGRFVSLLTETRRA